MGGKAKQAKYIAVPILDLARHLDNPTYYEPFCGSCAVLAQVAMNTNKYNVTEYLFFRYPDE